MIILGFIDKYPDCIRRTPFPRTLLMRYRIFFSGQAEYKVNKALIVDKSTIVNLEEIAVAKDNE